MAAVWLLCLQLLWPLGNVGTATADDGAGLPLVPQLNKSGSFGVFWSCGSSIKFTTCTTTGNVTCAPEKIVLTSNTSITAADVYYDAFDLYYIANGSVVHRLRLSTSEQQILHRAPPGLELSDIAVDWLNQELYLVQDRQIVRCDLNISSCTVALPGRIVDAREISVDPNNGYIFWTSNDGGAWRDTLPSDGSSAASGTQPVTLVPAQSSCPGKGFTTVSQQGVVYVYFYPRRHCYDTHPEVAAVVVSRTGSVGPVVSKYTGAEQHDAQQPSANTSFADSRGGLVCASNTTCLWMEPDGRMRVADLSRNVSFTVVPAIPADGNVTEAGSCAVLASWHHDLQRVPVPLSPPRNVEVIFSATSALITWEPPSPITSLILPPWANKGLRPNYESSWRNWMYKVFIRAAAGGRTPSSSDSSTEAAPEMQACYVPPRGINKCLFEGLTFRWMYNVSVIACSAAGESSPRVVYGSPPRDDSPLLMVTTTGLAYLLLRFSDGAKYRAVTDPTTSTLDAGAPVSSISDAAATDHGKMYVVLTNKTLVQLDITSGMAPPWSTGGSSGSATSLLPRIDACTLARSAEAVTWDWVSGSLYVATESTIVRSAAGCAGRSELLVAAAASALALEPLRRRVLLWITADRKALKYCKLDASCSASVATIYSVPCQTPLLDHCTPFIRSFTVDVEEGIVYWSLLSQPTVKTYAANLAQPNVWRELGSLQSPSIPSIAVYGGKLLRVINGTKLQVRDIRGDAVGYYPLASPVSGMWLLHNYSLWLLPGFSSIGAMNAATRPTHVSNATARVTVEGTWSNFTIRWSHLNTSVMVDVLYNVSVSGAGIYQYASFASRPSIDLLPFSVPPSTRLWVTVRAFTPWVTGEPFTVEVFSPAKVPPSPEGLQGYVEDTAVHIYWDQQYVPGAPVNSTMISVATLPKNDSLPLNYSVIGSASGTQRHFSFACQANVPVYFVKALACNSAGCSTFSSPLRVSIRAGEFTPLPRVVILQASGQIVNSDFRLTTVATVDEPHDNAIVNIAAIVGEHRLTLVWIDSSGCLYQKLAEARDIEIQVTCGLTLPATISVESSRRRLYVLQNGSAVVQVDLVTMTKKTVFRSAGRNITAVTFHEQQRKLYVLTGGREIIELLPDAPHQLLQSSSIVKKREAPDAAGCNCSDAARSSDASTSSPPKSHVLVITDDEAIAIYYLDDDGSVWRTNASACQCWLVVLPSMLGVQGFTPDEISAGGNRLYLYSKLKDCIVSVDLLGHNPFLLENMKIRNIWPYSTNTKGVLGQAPVPLLERLTVLNANEVRIMWRCLPVTCYAPAALDTYLLMWQVPQNGARPLVAITSVNILYSPFSAQYLLPATKYSMQVWVCSRDNRSCSFSDVSDIQTLHAPAIPAVMNVSNVSLTFVWTAPPDESVISHYIRVDSMNGAEPVKSTAVATAAGRLYTMTIHYLQPATDYVARVVVVYRPSSPREYQWPIDGVSVTTKCSPPTNMTISKVDCGNLPNSSCILVLASTDLHLMSKCSINFNLNINCHQSESDGAVLFLSSPVPKFVIPVSDVPPLGRREYCSAFARAVSPDGVGPWSSPVWLFVAPGSSSEHDEEDQAQLAGGLAGASVTIIIIALGIGFYLRKRRRQKQSLAKNRARREDRRSPEAGGQQSEDNVQLVVLRRDPGFDMLANTAYQTESVLREPATPSWSSSSGGSTLPKLDRQVIKLLRPLGSGAFGEVHAGIAAVASGRGAEQISTPVAVKTLRSDATTAEKSEFLKEAALMSQFHHENVVRLIGVCADTDPLYIVIELMDEGDLLNFVRRKRPTREVAGQLSLHMLLHMSLDIATGCEYLESLHFVHRDLAARNCLVSSNGHTDSCPFVKIGDFGLARDIYRNDYYRKEGEALLPVRWMSPESLVDGVFTNQSDVWSFGVLMWEVFSLGMQPYAAKSNVEVLYFVRNAGTLDRPLRCPLPMFQLISQCWSYVPKERPSFKAVRCSIEQILTDADQDTSLVAAYDRCNGRLTSDQEFFSTSSATDDGPMSARMVRQLSDVFDVEVKPPVAAAEGPVEYRSQNSIKGRLSKMFRRSANNSLFNRVHSQTDPESRKSNIYVRSDSVLSSDDVTSRLPSSSRDGVPFDEISSCDDELHRGSFGDFVLDSIAADQTSHTPHAVMAAHGAHVEAVSYSLVTPAAKLSAQSAPPMTGKASLQSGTRAALTMDAPREQHGDEQRDAVDGRLGATEFPSASAGPSAAVNYSLVVAPPPRHKAVSNDSLRMDAQSDAVACRLDETELPGARAAAPAAVDYSLVVALPPRHKVASDDSFRAGPEPHSVGGTKAPVAAKTSLPNSYAFDAHRRDASAATAVKRSAGQRRDELGLKAIDYSGSEPVLK